MCGRAPANRSFLPALGPGCCHWKPVSARPSVGLWGAWRAPFSAGTEGPGTVRDLCLVETGSGTALRGGRATNTRRLHRRENCGEVQRPGRRTFSALRSRTQLHPLKAFLFGVAVNQERVTRISLSEHISLGHCPHDLGRKTSVRPSRRALFSSFL